MLWVGEGKEWNRNVGLMEEGLMAVRNKVGRGVGFVGIYVCWSICGFLVLGTSTPAGMCRLVGDRGYPALAASWWLRRERSESGRRASSNVISDRAGVWRPISERRRIGHSRRRYLERDPGKNQRDEIWIDSVVDSARGSHQHLVSYLLRL